MRRLSSARTTAAGTLTRRPRFVSLRRGRCDLRSSQRHVVDPDAAHEHEQRDPSHGRGAQSNTVANIDLSCLESESGAVYDGGIRRATGSQIDEYLEEYRGPGIQHLAFLTEDILGSLRALEGTPIAFLDIDDDHYREVFDRVPNVREDRAEIARSSRRI